MAGNNGVLGLAVGPVGRALAPKLDEMDSDQFMQYAQQMQQAGVIRSFPEIIALKMQHDALKKQQAQAPTSSVYNDLTQAAAPPMPDARSTGVASLPNSLMGNAKFSGGGIVAFTEGGSGRRRRRRTFGPRSATPADAAAAEAAAARTGAAGAAEAGATDAAATAAAEAAATGAAEAGAGRAAMGLGARALGLATNPWVAGAAIGLPILYNMFKGDDEEKSAPAAEAPAYDSKLVNPDAYKTDDKTDLSGYDKLLQSASGPSLGGYNRAVEEARKGIKGDMDDPDLKLTAEQLYNRRAAMEAKLGYGGADEADRKRREKKRKDIEEEGKGSLWQNIGVEMLTSGIANAEQGMSTLGSMGSAIGSGIKGHLENKRRLDEKLDKLDDAEAEYDRRVEEHKLHNYDVSEAEYQTHKNQIREMRGQLNTLNLQAAQVALTQASAAMNSKTRILLAKIAAQASKERGGKGMLELVTMTARAAMDKSPQGQNTYNYLLQRLMEMSGGQSGAVLAAREKAEAEQDLLNGATGQTGGGGTLDASQFEMEEVP